MHGGGPRERAGSAAGSGRPTAGDVVVDGLLRAGGARIVTVGGILGGAIAAAARRHGLEALPVGAAPAAAVIAAVAARLDDAPACAVLPGVALAEAGAGVAHAFLDRAPLVLLSDTDAPGARVKGTLALEPASAGRATAHALRLALAEPRGPVHLRASAADLEASAPASPAVEPPGPPPAPDSAALDDLARALIAAERPVVVAGRGCRRAEAATWLRAFAEALPIPVVVAARARGALPDPHPLLLGVLGGPDASSRLLARADLILALGVDPLDLPEAPWPSGVRVVSVGRAPVEGAVALVSGDVAPVLEELAPRLRGRAQPDWDVAELDRLRRENAAARAARGGVAAVAALARALTPAGAVAAADAAHADDVAGAWQAVAPDELLTPATPDVAGFAVAAAVAASLARPAAPVIAFAETGAVTAAALETAARLALPVITVVVGGGGSPAPAGVPITDARGPGELRAALGRVLALRRRGPIVLEARAGRGSAGPPREGCGLTV